MVKNRMAIGVLAVAALLLVAPAAHAGPRFFIGIGTPIPVAPPAPVVVAPAGPYGYGPYGSGYVWRPAYYTWTGYGYQPVPGAWVRRPYPRAVWVGPRWVARPYGHAWVHGYWRRW